MKPLQGLSFLSLAAIAATPAFAADSNWLRHFRIGASAALNISTDFSMNGSFGVSGSNPGAALAGIDHIYDDGYVRVDDTGNALGATSFWGYRDASQYNGTDRLTFHGTTSFDAAGANKVKDDPQLGFDMVYAGTIAKWDRLSIGAEFGFNLTAFQNEDRQGLTGSLTQVVHTYNTGGILLPDAPYDGNPTGIGPAISDLPIPQPGIAIPGMISGRRAVEGMLYNFRLGPLFRWEIYPRWTLNASAGGAIGIFDAEYRFNESINLANGVSTSNTGRFGTTDLTYGGYASAVVLYNTGNDWDAFLGAHFLSLQDVELNRAGRSATTHLGAAIYLVAGINWSF